MPLLTPDQLAQRIWALPPHIRAEALEHWTLARSRPPVQIIRRSSEDQALYDACEWDRERFARTFLPHWCTHAFNQVHLDYYQLCRERQGSRGHKDVVAAPRGSSKTTGCALLGIAHDCVYQHEAFIVYLSNTYSNAEEKVKQLRDELEQNEDIRRVYGSQVGPVWNQGDFTTAFGVRVMAASRESQVRGITKKGKRPSKVVPDDIEHPDHVLTPEQRDKTLKWFTNDIMKLGTRDTNFEFSGTVLHPESLLSSLLVNPGWQPRFYASVLQFADEEGIPLWEEWRQIFIDLTNPDHIADARAFFEAHQAQMLSGSKVLWPEWRSYYDLMVSRLVDGEQSFWSEDMNTPRADSRFLFDMDNALRFQIADDGLVRSDGKLIHFLDMVSLAAYWDPTPDRQQDRTGDFTCFTVGMKDKYGYIYVVDAYCEQEASTDTAMDAIVDLIWYWRVPSVGVEINGFASLLPNELRRKIAARAEAEQAQWAVTFVPIKNMRSKILRIKTLDPLISNGWLGFADTLSPAFLAQFADFIPVEGANKFDDSPDSTEGLCRVLHGLFDRRAAF